MNIPYNALSHDGYNFIIKQSKLKNIPYGKTTVDQKGCGIIATYNAMKAAGMEPDFDDILSYFTKHAFMNGRFGSNAFQISGYLRKFNLSNGYIFCKKNFNKVDIGILWYGHKQGYHYVAFYADKDGKFNFLNADEKKYPLVCTMDEFFERYVKSKLCAVFVIKKVGDGKCL